MKKDRQSLYYIQTSGYVGNCLLWWRKEARGYTCNLDEAGTWTLDKAKRLTQREEDRFWPKEYIDENVLMHVDGQYLDPDRKILANVEGA